MKWIACNFLLLFFVLNLSAQDMKTDTILLLSENIYFDFGKDEIRTSEMNKLNEIATKIQGNINGFIRLTGHTDSIGTNGNNHDLSGRRANQVIQYLVGQRIAPLRFYTAYDGENIPVADNGSDKGRQLNRRVEMNVYEIVGKQKTKIAEPEEEIVRVEPKVIPEKPATQINFMVKDEETGDLVQAKIVYKRYITDEPKDYNTNPIGQGGIQLNINEDSKISFDFYAEGYFHNSDEILIRVGETKLVEILLKKIEKGSKLALKNLYFYGNQAKLLPESIPELRRLKTSLLMNPSAVVEIGGHINYPNTHPDDVPEWSVKLSERRAEVVYNYLVNSGVEEERLSHKGYSNTQMVNPKATQEIDMAPNRRVEIKVIEYSGTIEE